jgi:cytochrome c553
MLALTAASVTHAGGDPAAGARKNQMCQGCHGIPGWRNAYPNYSVPRLGGQHAQYLVDALKEYKAKARSNPSMQAIAAGLSDQDMQDLAAYYEGQRSAVAAPKPPAGAKP